MDRSIDAAVLPALLLDAVIELVDTKVASERESRKSPEIEVNRDLGVKACDGDFEEEAVAVTMRLPMLAQELAYDREPADPAVDDAIQHYMPEVGDGPRIYTGRNKIGSDGAQDALDRALDGVNSPDGYDAAFCWSHRVCQPIRVTIDKTG